MDKLNVIVDYDDETKTYYRQEFIITDELPEIENDKEFNHEVIKIEKIIPDTEDKYGTEKYSFYKLTVVDYKDYNDYKILDDESDITDYTYNEYIAIEIDDDEEER